MAKHPHLLLLVNKKTWKCAFEGCAFFVHLGLEHLLIGKHATCWECKEMFPITQNSLSREKPICDDCNGMSDDVIMQNLRDKGLV